MDENENIDIRILCTNHNNAAILDSNEKAAFPAKKLLKFFFFVNL